jgi:hypothetical protein
MNRIATHGLRCVLLLLVCVGIAAAQKGHAVMWERVRTAELDLYDGPGGDRMRPDLSRIEFIKEEKAGFNKKYRIRDGSGRVWVAKLGREARPETAAVRLLWALGYKTEINYLVPTITIPGKGTFRNVRLEARPDNVERAEEWKWKSNPFIGTKEFQGLKMMMVCLTNWDVVDIQNKVLEVNGERHYIVSDLGATLGKFGNNNFPIIYRLGRKTGSPRHYARTDFIKEVKNGQVKLAVKGKNRSIYKGITVADARWLANQMSRLSDRQIADAFRAANYSPQEVAMYTQSVRRKITELQNAGGAYDLAGER